MIAYSLILLFLVSILTTLSAASMTTPMSSSEKPSNSGKVPLSKPSNSGKVPRSKSHRLGGISKTIVTSTSTKQNPFKERKAISTVQFAQPYASKVPGRTLKLIHSQISRSTVQGKFSLLQDAHHYASSVPDSSTVSLPTRNFSMKQTSTAVSRGSRLNMAEVPAETAELSLTKNASSNILLNRTAGQNSSSDSPKAGTAAKKNNVFVRKVREVTSSDTENDKPKVVEDTPLPQEYNSSGFLVQIGNATVPVSTQGSATPTHIGTATETTTTTVLQTLGTHVSDESNLIPNVDRLVSTTEPARITVDSSGSDNSRETTRETVNVTQNAPVSHNTSSVLELSKVMAAVLICNLTFGCVFVVIAVGVLLRRVYDSYKKKRYTRLEYMFCEAYS